MQPPQGKNQYQGDLYEIMEKETNNLLDQENVSNEDIKNLIYTIRENQVMLDSDVARLYLSLIHI